MDLSTAPVMPAALTAQPPATDATDQSAKSKISSDFDTFLQMLTAQISNQDPMDPMKAEEFAVQLATFSNVEQQVKTNDLLESMISRLGGDQFSTMASYIGREAKAQMPVAFDGTPVRIDPDMPIAGSSHELVVRNAQGVEIHRQAVDAVGSPVTWSGQRSGGGTAAAGTYAFEVESFEAGELVATEAAAVYGRVTEVRQGPNGPTLAFAGGVEIPASDISALRESTLP